VPEGVEMTVKFYPKVEEFPDLILCPLCRNNDVCDGLGSRDCEAIRGMIWDMKNTVGGFLK
jgi:hypothetical protein